MDPKISQRGFKIPKIECGFLLVLLLLLLVLLVDLIFIFVHSTYFILEFYKIVSLYSPVDVQPSPSRGISYRSIIGPIGRSSLFNQSVSFYYSYAVTVTFKLYNSSTNFIHSRTVSHTTMLCTYCRLHSNTPSTSCNCVSANFRKLILIHSFRYFLRFSQYHLTMYVKTPCILIAIASLSEAIFRSVTLLLLYLLLL